MKAAILLFLFSPLVQANTEVTLPTISQYGLPSDTLSEDPIVPVKKGIPFLTSGSGSTQNAISNQTGILALDSGIPGNLSQVRGLGFSPEDIDVQTMGVSLNNLQGLGADLGIYPQFLWSDFSFQSGPSLSRFNPEAVSGTLSLTPWTVRALQNQGGPNQRFTASTSSQGKGLYQFSAASTDHQRYAVVGGYSSLQAQGPSGGFSTQWGTKTYQGRLHFIGTYLNVDVPGPTTLPSPHAFQISERYIPVVQNDFRIGNDILQTSVFYDYGTIHYENPDQPYPPSDTKVQQAGLESAYLTNNWKIGLSAKHAELISTHFQVPHQSYGVMQLSRSIEVGSFFVEPTFQTNWVTGFGALPQGSLGARYEWLPSKQAVFARASFSRKIPNVVDRYGVYSNFVGNPDLKTELDYTAIVGTEVKISDLETVLQLNYQFRKHARVPVGLTITNLGNASVLALQGSVVYRLTKMVDLTNMATLTASKLTAIGFGFPYLPPFMNVSGIQVGDKNWNVNTSVRLVSATVYAPVQGDQISGYASFDLGASVNIWKGLNLATRVENIFDRTFEVIKDYPMERSFSTVLIGTL